MFSYCLGCRDERFSSLSDRPGPPLHRTCATDREEYGLHNIERSTGGGGGDGDRTLAVFTDLV